MSRYHDEDYDGVVLKIPMGVIITNDMQDKLQELKEYFENCKFSAMHPDHQMNIRELEDYQTKVEEIAKERERSRKMAEDYRRREAERRQKLLAHDILPIERKQLTDQTDRDHLIINGKKYVGNEIYTQKGNIKSDFKKKFNEFMKNSTKDEVFEMLKENGFNYFLRYFNKIPPIVDHKELSIYINSGFNIGLTIDWPLVKVYESGKRSNDLFSRSTFLYYDNIKEVYYVTNLVEGGTYETPTRGNYQRELDDYEFDGIEFTRK